MDCADVRILSSVVGRSWYSYDFAGVYNVFSKLNGMSIADNDVCEGPHSGSKLG
jgi:hypothetical protein